MRLRIIIKMEVCTDRLTIRSSVCETTRRWWTSFVNYLQRHVMDIKCFASTRCHVFVYLAVQPNELICSLLQTLYDRDDLRKESWEWYPGLGYLCTLDRYRTKNMTSDSVNAKTVVGVPLSRKYVVSVDFRLIVKFVEGQKEACDVFRIENNSTAW